MDALGLLAAAIAVALYPGGAYLVAAASVTSWSGRLPAGSAPWSAATAAGTACALLAAALVPLPAAPSAALPDTSGAPTNVLPVLLLLGAAVALVGPPRWHAARVVAAAAGALPLLVLAAGAASFSFPVLLGLPGPWLLAARVLAGTALLAALPTLVAPDEAGVARGARAVVTAAVGVTAAALIGASALTAIPGALGALTVVAGLAVVAVLAAALRRLHLPAAAGGATAAVLAVTATVLAVVGTRP